MNRCVFLDKDGTLIENVPYNIDTTLITLRSGTLDGLKDLQKANCKLIVVTNQSGMARGYFTKESLLNTRDEIYSQFRENGITLNGFYFCPHHPAGIISAYKIDCSCRKPKPGMILAAAKDHSLNLNESWVIGDSYVDLEAGYNAGCKTVQIDGCDSGKVDLLKRPFPTAFVANINEAANYILQNHDKV